MSDEIRAESFYAIPKGTEILVDLDVAAPKVDLQFGATFGASFVRLGFDDVNELTKLITKAIDARAALSSALGKQLAAGETSEVVIFPSGSGRNEEIFGTYDQIGRE